MRTLKFNDNLSQDFNGTPTTTHLYRDRETGELLALEMCAGEKLAREKTGGFIISPEGRELVRAFREQLEQDGLTVGKKPVPQLRAQWPMISINGGVNPDQIDELREIWQEERVTGCEVLPNGDIKYEDRAARRADHKARGLFDKDGGYGDAMPDNC